MDANSEDWPALGHGAVGRGVHVRFDAPTPMDRDEAPPSRAVPRARADRPPGLAPAAPRWDPRLGGFPPRGRGRGHDGGYQHRPRRDFSDANVRKRAGRALSDPAEAAKRGLDQRSWVPTPPPDASHDERANDERENTFRVMSYNILASSLASEHPELYRGVDPRVMRPARRRRVLVEEIKALKPDVLFLQDNDAFAFFKHELGRCGYEGKHAPRGGGKLDGSSVFFKRDAFGAVRDFESIDFEAAEVGLRSNAAAILTLSVASSRTDEKSSPLIVVVGCVHGLFNPKRGDVKLGQMRVFFNAVARARARVAAATGCSLEQIHCVLGGDFNCAPSSPLYHFLYSGFLDVDRVDRRSLAGCLVRGESISRADGGVDDEFAMLLETGGFDRDDDEWAAWDELRGERGGNDVQERLRRYYWDEEGLRLALGTDGSSTETTETTLERSESSPPARKKSSRAKRTHEDESVAPNLRFRATHALRGALASCYRAVSADGEEAPVTSWHARFKGTVDYLFHTRVLRTRRVLMPPKKIKNAAQLPSEEFASDHFCVVADVEAEEG